MTKDRDLDVPGTTLLFDERGEEIGSGEVTLLPTPSADPEDPLNWSRNRKLLQLFCVLLYTAVSAFSSGCLYAIFDPLSDQTGLTLDQLNQGTGYQYFSIGAGALVLQPAALAFGKKPIYIFSCLFTVPVLIWTLYTHGNSQWIANRFIFGFVGGTVFTLGEASIADIYFYHQRAWPMGCYVAVTYAAALFGPVMGGCVYLNNGWKPVIYIPAALQAAATIFIIIFLEETNFDRRHAPTVHPETSPSETMASTEETKDNIYGTSVGVQGAEAPTDVAHVHETERLSTPWPGPTPLRFVKPIPNWIGIMARGFLQPFAMMPIPIIFWSGLMYGLYQGLFNVINALSSGVLAEAPYNFSTKAVGLTFISPLLATLPGSVGAGFVADWYNLRKARNNYGISEAEHKLDLFIVPGILCPIGCLMIGLGPYYGAHWIVFVIGTFVLNIAGPLATTLAIAYAFDCFHTLRPNNNGEVQTAVQGCAPYLLSLIFITMSFTFGFNYAITPWAFEWGLKNFAISSACVTIAFNASTLVMIKWGKQLRRWSVGYYTKVISF